MRKQTLVLIFFGMFCIPVSLVAQTEPEEITIVNNEFQDSFYESLLQKGIENYDKAIIALEKCLMIEPNNATVYFELGKNYLALKNYQNAYNSFEHATQLDPNNKWFWEGMYDVSYQTKNYTQAIAVINKLIPLDQGYKDDLISLYMVTNQYDKALLLINELNDKFGNTEERELYKIQILSGGKYQDEEIANLISQINKNPKEESNYINLIFLYSKNNDSDKVLEIAKKLELAIPTSEWAQVSLFKSYLDKNDAVKAIQAMNIVLASNKIDSKIKHRILNEFLIFVNANPQYTTDLEKAIRYFDNDKEVNVTKEIGKFYHNKKQWEIAIKYYEQSLKNSTSDDIETNLLLLQAYTEIGQFELVSKKATEMMETFPTQPQFYYYLGLSNNQLGQFKKAKEVLEMGLDYLVEDLTLEINFNIQLGEAYNGLGDFKKKEIYFSKANQLIKQK
nr:tetratricopeptide repeat protein [uncultured Flavobacterium sp.]